MKERRGNQWDGTGRSQGTWLVLLLLLAAALLPSACVLWFMAAAVRNEHLAVRQKLEDSYKPNLAAAAEQLRAYWQAKAEALPRVTSRLPPPQAFADLVTMGTCDSVVICDAQGRPSYPARPHRQLVQRRDESDDWPGALQLEHELSRPAAAAARYARIAASAWDANEAARALQAQARCLVKAGLPTAAVKVLAVQLGSEDYRAATDAAGRLIQPDALLLALEVMGRPERAHYVETLRLLHRRLTDYGRPAMAPSQRRFLMRRLREAAPGCPAFPTLAAEELAADYLDSSPRQVPGGGLSLSPVAGVWQMSSPDGRAVALFRESSIFEGMQSSAAAANLTGARVALLRPGEEGTEPFFTLPAGRHLLQWQLALYLDGPDPFSTAAQRQIAAYLWIGLLVIASIAIIVLLVARHLLRQIRLTRLKNDFIATVSHELKTPLSAMRVIVDTLLAGNYRDREQAVEYLHLASTENERLSRLIDNFLSFSRMERDAQAFELTSLDPAEVVEGAAELVRGRLQASGFRFGVDVAANLPSVLGDPDALTTALLNLLDNARKYSSEAKEITLRAYCAEGHVCFEVADRGIGLTRRAARKVFDRFYQADRALSRSTGGCGLGLSIVQFIARGHGGSVQMRSRPGEGSTFTLKLPASAALARQTTEDAAEDAD